MKIDRRTMARREFSRILRSDLKYTRVSLEGFSGNAGLLDIQEVSAPWKVSGINGEVVIADAGYKWLQLSPDEAGWWLTVMYDTDMKLVQYYFDITLENYILINGEPGFVDLFLDIIMEPGGEWRLIDRDELDVAWRKGRICEKEHALALMRAENLIGRIDGNEGWWRRLCKNCIDILSKSERWQGNDK